MARHKAGGERRTDSAEALVDTAVKSGATGVAATVIAVALCSPAGLGGMVGTSVASSLGFGGANAGTDEHSLRFPATPSPLTTSELQSIRDTLDGSSAQLNNIRAATDSEIEYLRTISEHGNSMATNTVSDHRVAMRQQDAQLAALLLPKQPA